MYKTKTLFSMITLAALSITADVQAMEPAEVEQPREMQSASIEEIARELEQAARVQCAEMIQLKDWHKAANSRPRIEALSRLDQKRDRVGYALYCETSSQNKAIKTRDKAIEANAE